MNDHNAEFERIVYPEFPENSPNEFLDRTPYGGQVKTGITPRGKAALAVAGVALTATVVVGWQISASNTAESEAKAQEIALKQDQIELEKLKVLNEANAANAKAQATLDAARQKKVDACVTANKSLVGKQLGATYRSVLEDCQAQYGTTNTTDMQAAGSATSTTADNAGGRSVSPGVLIGGVAIAGVVVYGARKARRNPT